MKKTPLKIELQRFDEEKLYEECVDLVYRLDLTKYKDGYVGYYAYGDAPAGIGGGVGCFLWFPTYKNLYRFLADYFVALSPGPLCENHETVFQKVGKIVQDLAGGVITRDKAIQQINWAAKGFSQIRWIGDLKTLCNGDEKFSQEVREQYLFRNAHTFTKHTGDLKAFDEHLRQIEEAKKSCRTVKVICKNDVAKFVEFLREFGA